mmetsp:Transcript_27455/g.58165  ORF Transcript_27455/g.58165 Transcript_27455/m.58165 type:complete len:200 (+) Transcript_27455:32-631(+)
MHYMYQDCLLVLFEHLHSLEDAWRWLVLLFLFGLVLGLLGVHQARLLLQRLRLAGKRLEGLQLGGEPVARLPRLLRGGALRGGALTLRGGVGELLHVVGDLPRRGRGRRLRGNGGGRNRALHRLLHRFLRRALLHGALLHGARLHVEAQRQVRFPSFWRDQVHAHLGAQRRLRAHVHVHHRCVRLADALAVAALAGDRG